MTERAMLFDFGGTLDGPGVPWLDRFYPIYLQQGLRTPRDNYEKAFHASDDRLGSSFQPLGLGLEETLTLQVRGVLEILAPERTEWTDPIVSAFLSESRHYIAKSRSILKRLSERFPLGVVSNFYGNLESVLTQEGLRGYFTVVADSGVVGSLKPDSKIFRYALRRLNASPRRTWMIGDSLSRDMAGAETLEMPHIWLTGNRPATPGGICPPSAAGKGVLPFPAAEFCCSRGRTAVSLEEVESIVGRIP